MSESSNNFDVPTIFFYLGKVKDLFIKKNRLKLIGKKKLFKKRKSIESENDKRQKKNKIKVKKPYRIYLYFF